jgi:bifunctional DNase/RNase
MPHLEMRIDSIRTGARLGNKRVLLLKQKSADRYLPIYIDARYADVIMQMLRGQQSFEFIDDKILVKLSKLVDMADSVSLVIDGFEKGVFHAKLIVNRSGKSFSIECPIGKALALCTKANGQIFAEEGVLDEAGITTKA